MGEDVDACRGALPRLPLRVRHVPQLLPLAQVCGQARLLVPAKDVQGPLLPRGVRVRSQLRLDPEEQPAAEYITRARCGGGGSAVACVAPRLGSHAFSPRLRCPTNCSAVSTTPHITPTQHHLARSHPRSRVANARFLSERYSLALC